MDSYRSEVRTQDLGTTYLYLANTGKVGHGLEVKKGMVWWWGEEGAYFGVIAQAILGKISCWDYLSPKRDKHELESLGVCYRSW